MTAEQILRLAENHLTFEKWEDICWKTDTLQLLKFAQEIRKQTINEILTTLEEVPNPEANRTAINRIKGI